MDVRLCICIWDDVWVVDELDVCDAISSCDVWDVVSCLIMLSSCVFGVIGDVGMGRGSSHLPVCNNVLAICVRPYVFCKCFS